MRVRWIVVIILIVALAPNAVADVCAAAVDATVTAIQSMVDNGQSQG